MRTFATLVLGIILGVVAIALGIYSYFAMGQAPVATSALPMPFEKKLAHQALNAIVRREMPKTVPLQPDESNLAAGAQTSPTSPLVLRRTANIARSVMDCQGKRKPRSPLACIRALRN